jgi:branched-chain amino acid transport system ATP-binding protein
VYIFGFPLLLSAENITVKYGGLIAVNDVSFSLTEGKILDLIGPNGAGKSTLFIAVKGFAPETSGKVIFYDQDVTHSTVY